MNIQPAQLAFAETLHGRIAQIIHREAGIALGHEKTSMMNARLGKRILQTGSGDLAGYVKLLEGQGATHELPYFISALTTNVTHFFRESHHFDFLRDTIMQPDPGARPTPLHVWSAGCSSGQEPYSIAIALSHGLAAGRITDLSILATDVDGEVLRRAAEAEYTNAELSGVPRHLVDSCFDVLAPNGITTLHRVKPALRSRVQFRQLNLHADWDLATQFDVIFCRNVVIYFDQGAQVRLWNRFLHQLRPGGWLIIGHSERVPAAMRCRLRPVGQTIYQLHPLDR